MKVLIKVNENADFNRFEILKIFAAVLQFPRATQIGFNMKHLGTVDIHKRRPQNIPIFRPPTLDVHTFSKIILHYVSRADVF